MKLVFLGFKKEDLFDEDCLAEFTLKYNPMIISSFMKYDPHSFVYKKEYEAEVKFFSICYSKNDNQAVHINKSVAPCMFISSVVEEIIDKTHDDEYTYTRYKTTLNEEKCEMIITSISKDDNIKVGDRITGLFKAEVNLC